MDTRSSRYPNFLDSQYSCRERQRSKKLRAKPSASDRNVNYGELSQERLSHLVNIASRCYARSLRLRLAEHGIPLGYWGILRTLWNEDGLIQSTLSERADLMPPTAHVVLKDMEEIGYVRREHKAGNRKNMHVYLTERGRKMMGGLMPTALEVNDVATEGLSAGDLKIMQRSLQRIIENLSFDSAGLKAVAIVAKRSKPAKKTRAR